MTPSAKPYKHVSCFERLKFILICCLWLSHSGVAAQVQNTVLDQYIDLPRQNASLYQILNQVTRQTGYYFIYDSDLIENDKNLRIRKTHKPLQEFLQDILQDSTLSFRLVEKHILIYRREPDSATARSYSAEVQNDPPPAYIKGRVLDPHSGKPLAYATVYFPSNGTGVITNTEGIFRLLTPLEMQTDSIRVSHIGYKPRFLPIAVFGNEMKDITLETDIISLQEVLIRYYDPRSIVMEALSRKKQNYSQSPLLLTTYYREGVRQENQMLNYSEAVFRIYKEPYDTYQADQTQLLKSRKFINHTHKDTLWVKLKAGVQTTMDLDIMKNIPDFLDVNYLGDYRFTRADLVSLNNRSVFAIAFKPAEDRPQAFFKGILYIDKESKAIVKADFELSPDHLEMANQIFIYRGSRRYRTRFQSVTYTVNYQLVDNAYVVNHVRGDLHFRVRRRNQLLAQNYYTFMEMVVCHTEAREASRLPRRQTFQANSIFADQSYTYDYNFWESFNIITPEKEISEALSRITPIIESLVTDKP